MLNLLSLPSNYLIDGRANEHDIKEAVSSTWHTIFPSLADRAEFCSGYQSTLVNQNRGDIYGEHPLNHNGIKTVFTNSLYIFERALTHIGCSKREVQQMVRHEAQHAEMLKEIPSVDAIFYGISILSVRIGWFAYSLEVIPSCSFHGSLTYEEQLRVLLAPWDPSENDLNMSSVSPLGIYPRALRYTRCVDANVL